MTVTLLSLYPELLNLYGEYANLSVLKRYLTEEGAEVVLRSVALGEPIPEGADFVYLGCGTESASLRALDALRREKGALRSYLEKDVPVLATGNNFELFGRVVSDDRYGECEGLGFFDFETARTHDKRFLSDAILTCPLVTDKVIGFINKCSTVTGIKTPFMQAEMGYGSDNVTPGEGIVDGSFYGTSLIGPLLIRNPALCRFFLKKIAEKTGLQPKAQPQMALQNKAYALALFELSGRLADEKQEKEKAFRRRRLGRRRTS